MNQVWVSEDYPERSFFIYQLWCKDYDDATTCNEDSFILTVRVNEKLFNQIVEEYQEKHNIRDRTTTYPFCIYGEFMINSLKQYVRKYRCKLLCEENFEVNNWDMDFPDDEFIAVKDEQKVFEEIWRKYSK